MTLKKLQAIGLTSALLLTTIGSALIVPEVKADSLGEFTPSIAVKNTSTNSFVSVGKHKTTGQVKIISENGQKYLEFDSTFATDNGPDLKVVLHRDSSVGAGIAEGSYITLAALQSINGMQRYLIPNNSDLETYSSVAIWCQQFNVTFGYAPLPDTTNVSG